MCIMSRNPDTLKLLHDAEKQLKDEKVQSYINLETSAEEREKGNKVGCHCAFPPHCAGMLLNTVPELSIFAASLQVSAVHGS